MGGGVSGLPAYRGTSSEATAVGWLQWGRATLRFAFDVRDGEKIIYMFGVLNAGNLMSN